MLVASAKSCVTQRRTCLSGYAPAPLERPPTINFFISAIFPFFLVLAAAMPEAEPKRWRARARPNWKTQTPLTILWQSVCFRWFSSLPFTPFEMIVKEARFEEIYFLENSGGGQGKGKKYPTTVRRYLSSGGRRWPSSAFIFFFSSCLFCQPSRDEKEHDILNLYLYIYK